MSAARDISREIAVEAVVSEILNDVDEVESLAALMADDHLIVDLTTVFVVNPELFPVLFRQVLRKLAEQRAEELLEKNETLSDMGFSIDTVNSQAAQRRIAEFVNKE